MKIQITKNEIRQKFNLPIGIDIEIVGESLMQAMEINTNEDAYFKITDDGTLKTSEIIEQMKSMFPVWVSSSYENIDEQFPVPKEPTTRYFKKTVEPDTDTLGLSVYQTLEKGITQAEGITLRERLLMEIAYFAETGKHLDVKGVTLCSGSRYSDCCVPGVYLYTRGEVGVGWYSLGSSDSKGGIRRAVTL